MRTTFIISVIFVGVLAGAFSSILPTQQISGQMMNPNMMMNRNMMPNGSFMNPNMMFKGSWINQGENITGSIKLAPTMINSITSQINVSLSDAASTAQKQAGNNSHVVAAHVDIVNGYLTYTVIATDPDANIHKFVIDAGNGTVLSSSKLSWQNMMMFGGMMGHNMMGNMMMNPNMMGNMMMNPNMMGNMMMNPNMMGNMMGFR
jgi:hypothetical protein